MSGTKTVKCRNCGKSKKGEGLSVISGDERLAVCPVCKHVHSMATGRLVYSEDGGPLFFLQRRYLSLQEVLCLATQALEREIKEVTNTGGMRL